MTMEQAPHSHYVLGKNSQKVHVEEVALISIPISSSRDGFFQWSEEKKSCVIAIQFRRGKI